MKIINWLMGGSIFAILVLMGNAEQGTLGTCGEGVLAGLIFLWTGFGAFLHWYEKEEKRKMKRDLRKTIESGVDEINRQRYIKETMAA
ncbi:MAG: hypothetical protein IJM94_02470 [Clostridia bacterium]|nr:hypothetical protein [Clostridia bacterium]